MRSSTDSQMEKKKLQQFKIIFKLHTYITAHIEKKKIRHKGERKPICCSVPMRHYVPLFVTPWTTACQASLSFTIFQSLLKLRIIKSVMPSNHLILSSLSPPALNLSQHQALFQRVSPSHQVNKVLEFQLQYQSLQ